MPSVKLIYGPYEAHGITKHRIQRLHGLITCLSQKGYEVEIVPSEHLNRLIVEMGGSLVFQCDIRNLLFNLECDDDPVCQRVVEGIQEAANRIYAESNIPTFVSIKEGKRYMERCKNLTTKDYFSPSIELLYEHQEHMRFDKYQSQAFTGKDIDKQLSLQDLLAEMGEDDYFDSFDEYADWDYASNIIRGIIDKITIDSGDSEDTTIEEDITHFDANFDFPILDRR